MNTSVLLYPLLSILSFTISIITLNTSFFVFSIFLYIASTTSALVYAESPDRNIKTDIISVIIYAVVSAFLIFLPQMSGVISKIGIHLNENSIIRWWAMLAYIPFTILPAILLYFNRRKIGPVYQPVVISSLIPSLFFAILLFIPDFRNSLLIGGTISVDKYIELMNEMKSSENFTEYYGELLSYLTINKESIVKNTIFLIPAGLFGFMAITTYITDRVKPLIKDTILIIREFRIPDNFVWILIAGGFLILVPNEALKYVAYNILGIFAVLYFFQGMSILNFLLNKYNVSIFIRALLFFFLIIQFVVFSIVIISLGLFSIWYKPKLTTKQEDKSSGENDGENKE